LQKTQSETAHYTEMVVLHSTTVNNCRKSPMSWQKQILSIKMSYKFSKNTRIVLYCLILFLVWIKGHWALFCTSLFIDVYWLIYSYGKGGAMDKKEEHLLT